MTTQQRYPTSDEATTGTWSTAPFWSAVDDTSDSDFITCTALASGRGRQTFGFTAFTVPAGATGISVAVNFRGKKASTQSANIGGALKVGGTYYDANGRNPATSYTAYTDSWATNPKSTANWTVDDVNGVGANALQAFGVTTNDTTPNVSASSVEVVVTYTPAPVTGAASLSASGTVTAVGVRGALGQAALAATATMTVVGRAVYAAKATLSAVATVTAVGSRLVTGVASLTAQATITAIGSRFVNGSASLAVAATVLAVGTVVLGGGGSTVTGAASLTATTTITCAAYSYVETISAFAYGYLRRKELNTGTGAKDISWTYYSNGNVDEIVVKQLDGSDVETSRTTIKHYQDGSQPTTTHS